MPWSRHHGGESSHAVSSVGLGCSAWWRSYKPHLMRALGAVAVVSGRHSPRQTPKFPLAPYSGRGLPNRPGICDSLLDFAAWLLLNLRGTGMKLSPPSLVQSQVSHPGCVGASASSGHIPGKVLSLCHELLCLDWTPHFCMARLSPCSALS